MTYKEIAEKICIGPRTIDDYRDNLFQKLEIKSRGSGFVCNKVGQ